MATRKRSSDGERIPRRAISAGGMPGPTLVGKAPHYVEVIEYVTSRARLAMHVGAACVPRHCIDVEQDETLSACMQCSVMYRNFACPPYAPLFTKLRPSADRMVIGWARIFPPEMLKCNPDLKFIYQMTNAERLTYHIVHKIGRQYRATYGGYLLGAASCRRCKPCAAKTGADKCANPTDRVFSLEATGVRCDKLMARLGWPLKWYEKGTGKFEPVIHLSGILIDDSGTSDVVLARQMMGLFKANEQMVFNSKEGNKP
jgi:predicted metal-binding protein